MILYEGPRTINLTVWERGSNNQDMFPSIFSSPSQLQCIWLTFLKSPYADLVCDTNSVDEDESEDEDGTTAMERMDLDDDNG